MEEDLYRLVLKKYLEELDEGDLEDMLITLAASSFALENCLRTVHLLGIDLLLKSYEAHSLVKLQKTLTDLNKALDAISTRITEEQHQESLEMRSEARERLRNPDDFV